MIAFVQGPVAHLAAGTAVVEVGGVGMAVQCTPATLAGLRIGESARLATSLVVREDSLTLYGFADDDERALFEILQAAPGVGPGSRRPCWACTARTRCASRSRRATRRR
ncbi:hypothetical protein GCM10025734_69260 [Kitasatospora paranensis]